MRRLFSIVLASVLWGSCAPVSPDSEPLLDSPWFERAEPQPIIVLAPWSLDWGLLHEIPHTATRIVISNQGSATAELSVELLENAHGAFEFFDTDAPRQFVLEPGDSRGEFAVLFWPEWEGEFHAQLAVTKVGDDEPIAIASIHGSLQFACEPGTPCDDGDPCTISDFCTSGTCRPGKPMRCDGPPPGENGCFDRTRQIIWNETGTCRAGVCEYDYRLVHCGDRECDAEVGACR